MREASTRYVEPDFGTADSEGVAVEGGRRTAIRGGGVTGRGTARRLALLVSGLVSSLATMCGLLAFT